MQLSIDGFINHLKVLNDHAFISKSVWSLSVRAETMCVDQHTHHFIQKLKRSLAKAHETSVGRSRLAKIIGYSDCAEKSMVTRRIDFEVSWPPEAVEVIRLDSDYDL